MINAGKNQAQRAGVYVRQPPGYRAVIPKPLPPNPPVQVNRLFDHPIVTVATVREWLGITPAGANQIVSQLVGIGLLQEITG